MASFPKPKRITNRAYLRWIKQDGCIIAKTDYLVGYGDCSGPIDPHHVIPVSLLGSDYDAIPVCRKHHDQIQRMPQLRPLLLAITKNYNGRYHLEVAPRAKPKREQKIKPFKKKPIHRAWAVLTPDGLESFDNHIGFQYPVFATLTDAKLWREEREATGWKIVRCQIRVEGSK